MERLSVYLAVALCCVCLPLFVCAAEEGASAHKAASRIMASVLDSLDPNYSDIYLFSPPHQWIGADNNPCTARMVRSPVALFVDDSVGEDEDIRRQFHRKLRIYQDPETPPSNGRADEATDDVPDDTSSDVPDDGTGVEVPDISFDNSTPMGYSSDPESSMEALDQLSFGDLVRSDSLKRISSDIELGANLSKKISDKGHFGWDVRKTHFSKRHYNRNSVSLWKRSVEGVGRTTTSHSLGVATLHHRLASSTSDIVSVCDKDNAVSKKSSKTEKTAFNFLYIDEKVPNQWTLNNAQELVGIVKTLQRVNQPESKRVYEFWVKVAYRLCQWFVVSAWEEAPVFSESTLNISRPRLIKGKLVPELKPFSMPVINSVASNTYDYGVRLVDALNRAEQSLHGAGVWSGVVAQSLKDMHLTIEAALGEMGESDFKNMAVKHSYDHALGLSKKLIHGMASFFVKYIRMVSDVIGEASREEMVNHHEHTANALEYYKKELRYIRHLLADFEHIFRSRSIEDIRFGLYFLRVAAKVLGRDPFKGYSGVEDVRKLESLTALGKLCNKRIKFDTAREAMEGRYLPGPLSQLIDDEYLLVLVFIDELISGETNGLLPVPEQSSINKSGEKIWGYSWSLDENLIITVNSGETYIPSVSLFNEIYDRNMIKMGEKFPAFKKYYRQIFMLSVSPLGKNSASFYFFSIYRVVSDLYSEMPSLQSEEGQLIVLIDTFIGLLNETAEFILTRKAMNPLWSGMLDKQLTNVSQLMSSQFPDQYDQIIEALRVDVHSLIKEVNVILE